MTIDIVARTNKDYCMIETATIKLKGGGTLVIDRDETEYSISDDGILEMSWNHCYIWGINDEEDIFEEPCYLNDSDCVQRLMEGAKLDHLLLEEDADEDYEVEVLEFSISA